MQKVRSTSKIVVLLAVVGAFAFGQTARAGSSWTSTANATKSVSLIPPPACGGNSSIAVTAGTTVYFCYTVFNNSGVNGTYDLFDNIIGTIAQNATAPAGQPSRKWASWIAVANSTNGVGTVVNNATWTLPGAGAVFAAAQAMPTPSRPSRRPVYSPSAASSWRPDSSSFAASAEPRGRDRSCVVASSSSSRI